MAHFMIAQLEGGRFGGLHILQAGITQLMKQQLFTNDSHVGGWAYGYMEMDLNGQRLLWHRGDTPLFHSLLILCPGRRLGLFVSYNGDGGSQALMPLLIIALVAAGLAIGATAATLLVWKRRYWNLTARIHSTLVVLAAVALVWWLHYWNLLGLRLE
jgi:hypothetical protein